MVDTAIPAGAWVPDTLGGMVVKYTKAIGHEGFLASMTQNEFP